MKHFLFLLAVLLLFGCADERRSTIFLIGDSTVKNGNGDGSDGLWGWGDFLHLQLDTTRVTVVNKARGGRSSRTFITEGLWDSVKVRLQPGDFVLIQFGHNDGGNINDNHRARGTIRGNGEDSVEIDNILTGKHEVVHSYGWYIRKYIRETKERGANPIVCSLVARNIWEAGKVVRASDSYTLWAREAAEGGGAYFIDLNDRVASKYEELGEEYVTTRLFLTDHTHTTQEGAIINSRCVADGIVDADVSFLSEVVE